jgi:VIT1/CCC1 family predicted Fe2+/Mn2+ transporter
MKRPSNGDLEALRQWLKRAEFGNMFLTGYVEDVWDTRREHSDYASLKQSIAEDASLTGRISMIVLHLQRALLGRRHGRAHIYSLDESIRRSIANGFLTVISSVLPVLPIFVLYFVHRPLIRLILTLLFTIAFASALVFGMGLRSDAVLAITTA